ncbi:uncharacterized protein LOC105904989 [Clupea harengus]|uniref:Uncharacterized protein LOC105904989 n=1 Tax=Clupea harengus TaxID=7950 RepID=A0A6P3W2Z6_CLUHA|nr:uncharacterized protein LOC105904989 [Clupea harengus]
MGGNQCCVTSCRGSSLNHRETGLEHGSSLYRFPAWTQTEGAEVSDLTKRRRLAWIAAVGRRDITFDKIPVWMKVCSRHFQSGRPGNEMLEDDPDWVPHLHMKREKPEGEEEDGADEEPKGSKAAEEEDGADDEEELQEHGEHDQSEDTTGGTDDSGRGEPEAKRARPECESCSRRRERINRLLAENEELRYELERLKMNEYFLEEDDEKVRYYTGLQCFAVLMGVLTHVLPHLPDADAADATLLSPFQKVLLTLMRLRLDLPVPHLAHLFNVAPDAVTRTFAETLGALHAQLTPLVYWPERGSLLASVPRRYAEALGERVAVVIVDCLEICIERPSSMKGREQTYSHPRRGHTMKYLVGMTPQGAISFVSPALGGRATDLQVAEGSGILERLACGDYVLAAGRGFEVPESAGGVMCAQVKSGAFGKGRRQLDVKGEEETRPRAHLRADVERAARGLRQRFALLEKTMPISMLLPGGDKGNLEDPALLDKIVTVCCALLNMCPNVVEQPGE